MKSKKNAVKYDSKLVKHNKNTFKLNINDLMNIGWLIFLKIVVFKDKFNSKVIEKVIDNFKKVTPLT
jgi:hypothetical protein